MSRNVICEIYFETARSIMLRICATVPSNLFSFSALFRAPFGSQNKTETFVATQIVSSVYVKERQKEKERSIPH